MHEKMERASERVWVARCQCYKNHNSASGRCNCRNVEGTQLAGGAVVCDECRDHCRAPECFICGTPMQGAHLDYCPECSPVLSREVQS